jgi:hypothetical protein
MDPVSSFTPAYIGTPDAGRTVADIFPYVSKNAVTLSDYMPRIKKQ